MGELGECPIIETFPLSNGRTPEITLAKVLLPHPLPPTIACISPKFALKLTPFRAFVTPKDLSASWTYISPPTFGEDSA